MARNSDTELVVADVDTISDLAGQLNVAAARLEEQINAIYANIASLNESWAGESYDNFSQKCKDARPSLNALVLFVKAYAELLDTSVKSASEKYINEATSVLGGIE